MNILKKFWTWLSQPDQVHQPVEETKAECCGKCDCAPKLTEPTPSVAEFYQNDEGYTKALYGEVEDYKVVSTPVPEAKKRKAPTAKKPAVIATKKPVAKKPTPSKKVPPHRKPTPKKK